MKNPGGVKVFGVHLRRLREERGMSQMELADYANVSNKTVHRIETGQFAVTIDVLLSLTKALKLPLHKLLNCPGIEQAD